MKRTKSLIASALVSALSLTTYSSIAAVNSAKDLQQLSDQSQTIVHGKVASIEYKDSVEGIPHTFVTYDIIDDFQGYHTGNKVTLKFIGGIKKITDTHYEMLEVSNVPEFEMDEENVLFLKREKDDQCPLVNCSEGFFKIKQGKMFAHTGNPVNFQSMSLQQDELDGHGELGTQAPNKKAMDAVSFVEFKNKAVKGMRKAMFQELQSADSRRDFRAAIIADERAPVVPRNQAAKAKKNPENQDIQ